MATASVSSSANDDTQKAGDDITLPPLELNMNETA